MIFLQYTSICIEVLIAVIAMIIFLKKKKNYGLGFFITFGIYVFYDLSRLVNLGISELILQILFFIASISALYSIWGIYKLKK